MYSNAPCVYVEADFHDVPDIAKWLIENTVAVGEAICKGICNYFGVSYIAPKAEPELTEPNKTNNADFTMEIRTLRLGSKGEDVRALQILLIGNGYPCGKWGADGDFGIATENAVKEYQRKVGLTADGIAGLETWSGLLG